ncbi:alpha/beta hydrolase [Streptomyces sp. NPDC032161]|uniref:alpha/beta fold hydrolase n=1 Tax=unclassified Streptomyces TaxID=2593676 RepID=UPI0033D5ED47
MSATFEPITGRYLRVAIEGVEHRVYVEEAGRGIPLMCLHTAGSDGRQYRHLMNDASVTDRFRVISFDMPWHGKSSPAPGWRDTEYELTADSYAAVIHTVIDTLLLDRPVLMGCSIGGRIVLKLARDTPERFRALIGLQSGAKVAPYYDREYLHRPDVHGGELCAALMSGLIGPDAPEADRDETLWHYAQGGPGVFKGDLHFYKDESDDDEALALIDTTRCPLYLLTGEYDYSCMPADTEVLAKKIAGTEAVIMSGLGHFPMSEDHALFMSYLAPVLDRIEAAD